ncbi:MAG: DUF3592 domain-containing protein [Colwellia sp.]
MKLISKIKIISPIIGICFIIAAALLAKSTSNFITFSASVEGEVIGLVESISNGSVTYAPVVGFFTLNESYYEFESSVSSSPPAYRVGESIGILYLTTDPNEAKINGFFSLWGGAVILALFGVVFLSIGIGIIGFSLLKKRKGKYLIEHGLKVEATISKVEINYTVQVNGRSPYRIFAKWLDPKSNKLYVYKSKNLWFDPTDYIESETITVYVDKQKPQNYFLDVSFLPSVVE